MDDNIRSYTSVSFAKFSVSAGVYFIIVTCLIIFPFVELNFEVDFKNSAVQTTKRNLSNEYGDLSIFLQVSACGLNCIYFYDMCSYW